MKSLKPNRVIRTYTQRIHAEPSRVFPLLCPVRESEWIEGWDPVVVLSDSGVAEPDCVFVTSASDRVAIWYVTRHEPQDGFVEMLKITPGVTACRLTIQVQPAPGGSDVTIAYSHTSLGPEGDAFVAAFDERHYGTFMRDWELRMNHFLAHGTAMPGGH
jgi:hypothetical protein